jgi:saccharopine dehydrogenase-like NADP-dependent oxidoreductase
VTKALVLGSGMVGSVMAADLAEQPGFEVTIADARSEALERARKKTNIATITADLAEPSSVKELVRSFDVVLGALPSAIGFQTLRAVLEANKPYCDISSMPEDAFLLDPLAKERGVCAIVDCGVAPGMSNMIAGYAATTLSPCEEIAIYVGGLPLLRRFPYEYKAAFSPHDVIEQYVRPSRIVENGKLVVKEALSEVEHLDFPGVGTLEAFNTDGLRSLASTLGVPNMKEKTMRYPGHVAMMKLLRETGFFSKGPVDIGGARVRPLDLTAKLLFPKWTYDEGEADLTVMRVVAMGMKQGKRTRMTWDLLDRYDPATGYRSMSRATGFPATIVAAKIARGEIAKPGVHTPEALGAREGFLAKVLAELERRGVKYRATIEVL